MDNKHNLVDLMGTTMGKIREMVDVNTIVGQAITTMDGSTIIPVSKLSFGFGAGGSDYGKESANFGGGSGAGVNITPVSFLVINGEEVRLLPVTPPAGTTIDRLVEMTPSLIEKIQSIFSKKKNDERQ